MAIAEPVEQRDQIVNEIRKWVDAEVIPAAKKYEQVDEYPFELVEQMKEFGLFGAIIPEEYGGIGLSIETYAMIVEEISRGWMSVSGVINSHLIMAYATLVYGTEEQKQKYLPKFATGELRGGLCLSEPHAGSDAQAIRTAAVRQGDKYVVNGRKMWITNGRYGNCYLLIAKTDLNTQPAHRGISAFIAEKNHPGFKVGRDIKKLGYRGVETVELFFEDYEVPAANLVGGVEGQGFKHVLSALEVGRINVAARGVGVAQAAFNEAIKYAQQRESMGSKISEYQAIQLKLADMATKIEASRHLVLAAARRKDAGERVDLEAGMAKLFASETALECATESMRIHGGVGFSQDLPVERFYRDAPLMIIGEGTNEIQRIVIARQLLQKYKI